MKPEKTALILIGYQNDYFSPDGILHSVIEESSRITGILANTLELVERLLSTQVLLVSTPIIFTPDYSELVEPVGILKTIKEVGAFKAGTKGSETIPELQRFGDRIIEIPGKRGLNAFSNTDLDRLLRDRGITDVVLAGTVTSICIDSTGRSAHERGFKVYILSDCTSARTNFEQDFYCEQIFPLYADVINHWELLKRLEVDTAHG
jgi:nicotinamidase-related amidase